MAERPTAKMLADLGEMSNAIDAAIARAKLDIVAIQRLRESAYDNHYDEAERFELLGAVAGELKRLQGELVQARMLGEMQRLWKHN